MMPRVDWSAEKLIKIAIWVVFVAMALSAIFDFDDWADSAKWMVRSILIAVILHVAVSWIYRKRDVG
jgi:cell division protein FtsL